MLNNFLKKNDSESINLYKRFFINKNIDITLLQNQLKIFKNTIYGDKNIFNHQCILELNIFFLYVKNNYKTVRLFFGYPYSNRTRTNGNCNIKNKLFFKSTLIKYVYSTVFFGEKEQNTNIFFFIEFFNKLWFFFWYNEWKSAKISLFKAMKTKFSKWKYGYIFLTYNRPIVFLKKKNNKKKNNKKRIAQIKNTYNIGFFLGFSVANKETVKRFNIFKKKK